MDWIQIYSLVFIVFHSFVLGVIYGRIEKDVAIGWLFIGVLVLPFILNVWGVI